MIKIKNKEKEKRYCIYSNCNNEFISPILNKSEINDFLEKSEEFKVEDHEVYEVILSNLKLKIKLMIDE